MRSHGIWIATVRAVAYSRTFFLVHFVVILLKLLTVWGEENG